MICLILGGSASGKSEYAEDLVLRLSSGEKTYLAAMEPYGEEARSRIERHRRLREGKGFLTVEKPRRIEEAAGEARGTVLLETVSILLANELFTPEGTIDKEAPERVMQGIQALSEGKKIRNLVMVSDLIFSGELPEDPGVLEYVRSLGELHRRTAFAADLVAEVTGGIPFVWKGGRELL